MPLLGLSGVKMANLDTSELLTDSDFVDAMQIITRAPSINFLGENTLSECIQSSVGSIQPASGKVIQRLPEALRNANNMSFWFKGLIIASAPGRYSSILVFKGQRFQVKLVFDWTSWGAGWCEGVCVAEVPA